MSDLSSVMNVAKDALLSHASAINITGSNIANVNTPGYSRLRPVFSSVGGAPNCSSASKSRRSRGSTTSTLRFSSSSRIRRSGTTRRGRASSTGSRVSSMNRRGAV